MKLFDKKAEKRAWLALASSVPILIIVLWQSKEQFGLTELTIALATLLSGIGIVYLVKCYANS